MTPAQAAAPASPRLTGETIPQDLVDRAVGRLPSKNSRRAYRTGIADLLHFAGRRAFTPELLHRWRDDMARRLKPTTANGRIAAMRTLFREAQRAGLMRRADSLELRELPRLRELGSVTGNWLTRDQARELLDVPNRRTLRGKRDYCVLAVLLGCALRRTELAELRLEQIQMREGRWVIADLRGKGGRLRTVAVPGWVKQAIDAWTTAAAITSGPLIRRVPKPAKKAAATWKPAKPAAAAPAAPVPGLSTTAIWRTVHLAAVKIGVPNFSPHDLRRTCAKLCRGKGGRIEQIQAMLGHASIATTERYLGTVQDLRHAVNDDLGLWSEA